MGHASVARAAANDQQRRTHDRHQRRHPRERDASVERNGRPRHQAEARETGADEKTASQPRDGLGRQREQCAGGELPGPRRRRVECELRRSLDPRQDRPAIGHCQGEEEGCEHSKAHDQAGGDPTRGRAAIPAGSDPTRKKHCGKNGVELLLDGE